MRHVPNALSVSRIILTLLLFFLSLILTDFVLSPNFLMIYAVIGLTDFFDGLIARRFNVASQLGANIDGIADYILIFVALIIIVPHLELNALSRALIVGFVALKCVGVIVGYIHYGQLMMMHTFAGKIAGLLALSVPFVLYVTKELPTNKLYTFLVFLPKVCVTKNLACLQHAA
ncbi:MAG: CDP-alcohol phosphatidyltransferase family protein, partial [Defluviitaleaceae bacterium]|nr:CDP-alcohol phosphatidyltransferase family protein [Defluviitaleaceae bacterium]